jgi:hypothetical protein
MRESDLYPPVRDWLIARGYEVHVEIFGHDIVALKDGKALVVELKLGLTRVLTKQLESAANWADEVMGAVGVEVIIGKSGECGAYRYNGFGLLQVVGGKVRQRIRPK